jgi:GT2 family glycosyltransferase/lipopolysaccharide/colanic/teichoic acid biosynthesis glycosyltransferase
LETPAEESLGTLVRLAMDLSIIIVNYNVRDFLENALLSIQKALEARLADGRRIDGEVFVVDNASDDGSVDLVKKKFPQAHLIANQGNLGFARANNIALVQASGRYLLLINPDTVVQEDTLKVMIDFFDANPDVGAAGCKILNPDGTLQLACRRSFPTPWASFTKTTGLSAMFPRSQLFGRYNLTYLNPDESYEVDAVSGSFMMVRHVVYEQVGGLDETFFMYGEDLDWCYRIQKAGWKIYYLHKTQIIHYKGESTKRSDIDELNRFYDAMQLFVKKHLSGSLVVQTLLRIGIMFRKGFAFVGKVGRPLLLALVDFLLVDLCLLFGEYLWFGKLFRFPRAAYPVVLTVPAIVFVSSLFSLGVYTNRKPSLTPAALGVIIGFFIISSLTFFFKDYAFSRAVVIISSGLSLALLPGWRALGHIFSRRGREGRPRIFGRRTLIVGVENSGQEVLRKLRARLVDGYDVVGFIDINRKRLGQKIMGIGILGSIENIGKIIRDQKVTEVIFSTDALSYADILSIISRSRERSVNFRLVPSSMEVIIGKTHIDQLDDIPLLEIEYNIDRAWNRITKRVFDLVISLFLVVVLLPYLTLQDLLKGRGRARSRESMRNLLSVVKGEMSLVGPYRNDIGTAEKANTGKRGFYLGKPGITGLAQLHPRFEMIDGEVEKYNLYYAKNQSLWLDAEILVKSLLVSVRKSKGGKHAQGGS